MAETIFPIYERMKDIGFTKKAGGPVIAFIQVYLREKTDGKNKVLLKNTAKKLAKEKIVQAVYIVAGECDILLNVAADSVFGLGKFVSENLREYKGIQKTVTLIVLDSVK